MLSKKWLKSAFLGAKTATVTFHLGFFQKSAIGSFTNGDPMIARDLERLLIELGVGAAKVDAVTRKLRAAGHLPRGGRGRNAPLIGAREAALALIAIAGSTKGNEADTRMIKLLELASVSTRGAGRSLLDAVVQLMDDSVRLAEVVEVRVGRTTRYAAICYKSGKIEEFVRARNTRPDRFSVEGIIPRSLLERVALGLRSTEHRDQAP